VHDIKELRQQGLSICAIAAMTGFDRKTIRRYLANPAGVPKYGPRPKKDSKLAPFKAYIEKRLESGVWNAAVLMRELRERGYPGSYTILKDHLQPKREAARAVAVRRFETPPGHQAQVDWGHLGTLETDGRERQLWGFTFTLGYSRMMMAEAALDQKLGTLLRMHEEAFRQLGGIPDEILYDRMRTVWKDTDERGEIVPSARFMGGPVPVRPPWPIDWAERAPRNRGLPGYDDRQAMRLLTQGAIDRNGNQLRPPMPRFRMTPQDAADVIAYMRSLEQERGGQTPR
jgi:transposase